MADKKLPHSLTSTNKAGKQSQSGNMAGKMGNAGSKVKSFWIFD